MNKPFVVISGLPASGKSTVAQYLARELQIPLLDKDAILEGLFEAKGVGDMEWRRALSRESDAILQAEAIASGGAVLVSHWHMPGMAANSGTPTGWLVQLSNNLVNIHCSCPCDLAARRFVRRERHPGHLDRQRSPDEVLDSIQAIAGSGHLRIARRIEVDTSRTPRLERLLHSVRLALAEDF